MATGKSSWKSGGKKRSACFLEKPGLPARNESVTKVRTGMNFLYTLLMTVQDTSKKAYKDKMYKTIF
jgi:hypothetical protein